MDLDCEESAYDAYEYESDVCDDAAPAEEYDNDMYNTTWPVYSQPTGYSGYANMSSYGADPRYCSTQFSPQYNDIDCPPAESQACTDVGSTGYSDYVDECDSAYGLGTMQDCTDDCGPPCGSPASQICPLPDPNVQCPPCILSEKPPEHESDFESNGAKSICGKNLQRINEIIKNITTSTVLDEFMLSIASYTADNGEAMFDSMSNEVNNFKELIKEIYANRNDAISELLKDEQRQMKNKYEKWTKQSAMKSEETLEKIREILPSFEMAFFIADPSNYIYSAMMEVSKFPSPDGYSPGLAPPDFLFPLLKTPTEGHHFRTVEKVKEACTKDIPGKHFKKEQKNEEGRKEISSLNPDRNVRVAMHKRTWLMREAERIECDNEERMCKLNEMMAQLACLSEGLATSNKKLAAYNRQLESHATCLRNKLGYNETVLGCLQDEIELNKVEATKEGDECTLIEPDSILTPYPSGYDYC